MATRFCGVCGTEVDEDAAFCPSCGSPLDARDQQAADIPPAPAWPEPEPEPERVLEPERDAERDAQRESVSEPVPQAEPGPEPQPQAPAAFEPVHSDDQPTMATRADAGTPGPTAAAPPPPRKATALRPADDRATGTGREQVELPFTWPVMLSGWLIGVGSLVAALALLLDFRTFANPVTLFAFLLLLAVAATVFLASNIPDFSNRRLWVLVVVVAAFGIGLWRVGFGANFAGVVFFLAALAAAIGAVMVELGRDRPMGGPVG